MSNYYIYLVYESKFVKVNGKKIIIKGFEDFDFFVSRRYGPTPWSVSDGISGSSVVNPGERLRKDAISKAEVNLANAGKDEVVKLISEYVDRYGISPRYLDRCLPKIK